MSPSMSLSALIERLNSRELSAQEALEHYLAQIDLQSAPEHDLNAIIHHAPLERLRAHALAVDQARDNGAPLGPLAGVPLLLKDNILEQDQPAQAASRILEGFISPYDATVTRKLKAAGALIIGRTNQDELAMGSSNEHSIYGPAKNPHDKTRTPGGSSGGSAAAVAAGLCAGALGSDTGGSIRQPAAYCGVVGLKPTYGRVSRFGLIAFASSLDQIGPLSHTVEDAARLLEVIAGHDAMDMTSAHVPVPKYTEALGRSLKGLKVGLPREYMSLGGLDDEVAQAIERASQQLTDAGATLHEVSLPHTKYAIATYYLIATAEASSNLARYDGVRYGYRAKGVNTLDELYELTRSEGFGDEVKRRIMLGTFVLSAGFYDAYYLKAQRVRTLIRQDFERAFTQVDLLLTPTTPGPAFVFGAKSSPLQMYLEDIFTISCNLAGLPGISVPAGLNTQGLPLGVQLMARHFDEATMLNAASHLERSRSNTP